MSEQEMGGHETSELKAVLARSHGALLRRQNELCGLRLPILLDEGLSDGPQPPTLADACDLPHRPAAVGAGGNGEAVGPAEKAGGLVADGRGRGGRGFEHVIIAAVEEFEHFAGHRGLTRQEKRVWRVGRIQ